jgi:hypothetical protein
VKLFRFRSSIDSKWAILCSALFLLLIGSLVAPAVVAQPTLPHHLYLPLVVAPPPTPTSEQLIEAALARGEIDEETALVYKVFALFGDERLPPAYRGDDSLVDDSDALQEAAERLDSLSPQAQAMLEPFLLRPPASGSWLEQSVGESSQSTLSMSPQLSWGTIDTVNGKVKVWYQHRYPGDQSKADEIALALDAIIWPALFDELKMKEPLSDFGLPDSGGDGRLDIYLVHIARRGVARPLAGCEETPAYLLIDSERPIGSATRAGILQTVVHELMHASQFAYPVKAACSEYDWWAEASAKWAEDYVYPLANSEQPYAPSFLERPERPLEEETDVWQPYGAYLWPFYLTHMYTPDVVSTIWAQTKEANSLEAIDRSISGGFDEQWPDFTLANWNRLPLDYYQRWDKLNARVRSYPIGVYLEENGDAKIQLPLSNGVEHLAAEYFHFDFPDDNVRTFVFYNGYTFRLSEQQVTLDPFGPVGTTLVASPLAGEATQHAHVKALVKTASHDWVVADWTDKGLVRYCRDAPQERLEELILIFSSSEHKDRRRLITPVELPPTLWVSNIGCWEWEGEINAVEEVFDDGPLLTMKAQVRLQQVGTTAWPLAGNATGEWLTHDQYEPMGTLEWQFSGADSNGCTWSGSGNVALSRDNSYLTIATYATGGELHRAYEGHGETDPLLVIGQRSCPGGTGGPYGWSTWWFPAWPYEGGPLASQQGGFAPFHVSTAGPIDDARDFHSGAGAVQANWQISAQSSP